ncbi:epimerase [Achromatium sp. WMS3]|nr:epimerase [Achromatium sp. WMS3]
MSTPAIHAVTGAFGYSGRYIVQRLLAQDHTVMTLTNSPKRANNFAGRIKIYPYNFENPQALIKSLQGVEVLYNTYWVRFNHRLFKHSDAVANTLKLFKAARQAGVQRIVHVSITNPDINSPLEYFSDKAKLEQALIASEIPYAILRPTVIFGKEDILINNIAWILRTFPIFGMFGDGDYRIQPIYVEDLAGLAVKHGKDQDNTIINAIGPETFRYRDLITTISNCIGVQRPIISIHPQIGYILGKLIGYMVNDVIITREEIAGLMANLLYVDAPPTGVTKLSNWIEAHAASLGKIYTSELARRFDRISTYRSN